MKKSNSLFPGNAVFLLIPILLFSCGKDPDLLQHIPAETNFVVTIDVKNIGPKIAEIKNEKIEKIKNAGIDFSKESFVFGTENYTALSIILSDVDQFEEFLKTSDANLKIISEAELKFSTPEKMKGVTVGWNKNMAIFFRPNSYESINPQEKIKALFQLKKEEGLVARDTSFQKSQKQKGDISFWVNLEKIGKMVSASTGTKADFKEAFVTGNLNFENGQAALTGNLFPNKEMESVLSLTKPHLATTIIEAFPGKTATSVLGLAINMDSAYSYFEKEKLLENINLETKETGLSSKEVFQIFSGDVGASFNGVLIKEVIEKEGTTGEEITKQEGFPEYSIILGIRDKNLLPKLLSALVKNGTLKKSEQYYITGNNRMILVDKGDYLLVASSEYIAQQSAKGEKLTPATSNLLSQNSFALHADISKVPDELLNKYAGSFKELIKNSQVEAITLSAAAKKDKEVSGNIVIAFKNKTENSLVSTIRMYELFFGTSESEPK